MLPVQPPALWLGLRSCLTGLARDIAEFSKYKSSRRCKESAHQQTQPTNAHSLLINSRPHHPLAMKFTSTLVSLAALFSVASADVVRFNTIYDNPSASLNTVACSDGANGLITKGFSTFAS